jgi:4-diphosphocytidyl-2-C-methyl-D-erythritol kinase
MVSFPNCKINLGLRILGRRPDGYHDLETVFFPIPLKDVLEIVRSDRSATEQHAPDQPATEHAASDQPATRQPAFTATGLPIPGDKSSNLCIRAWQLLKKDFPDLPPVHIHLHKLIPMGAGLGGGSADGAFLLQLLNEEFQLKLDAQRLSAYALQLGSDCPFFLVNQPCLATGRGEKMEPLELELPGYALALVYPGMALSTARAFAEFAKKESSTDSEIPTTRSLREIIDQPVENWRGNLINDFEAPACKKHPELQAIKDRLYDAGAIYASMTGSGSAFYGLFRREKGRDARDGYSDRNGALPTAALFPNYFFRIL